MRPLSLLLLPTLLALSLACSGGGSSDDGKLRVVATTTQIGDFAANVGRDRIALTTLLKPNQDAHDFEPSPSQIRALLGAAVVLRHGIGLDAYVDKAVEGSSATLVTVTEDVKLIPGHEEQEDEDHAAESDGEQAGMDPHVWLSVANAKLMVAAVRDALGAADAANAPYYAENAAAYLQSLDALDARIRARVAEVPAACRKLVTNHEVLGYFAQAYGFEIVGSVIPSTSSEAQPSASDVAQIVAKIRAENVPAIFAEASINPALIRQVGREAKVKVVDDLYGDSLGSKGSDGATYAGMMEANTRKINDALKDC